MSPSSTERPANALLAFLPMLYIGWADAVLTPSQAAAIRELVAAQKWLTAVEKETLDHWLNPAHPPSAAQMKSWLAQIRETAAHLPDRERCSLADLGLRLAHVGAPSAYERCATPAACRALGELETALGVTGTEAAQTLLPKRSGLESPPIPLPSFDVDQMTHLLDGRYGELRRRIRTLLTDPAFTYFPGGDKEAYREKVLAWAKILARQGIGALSYPVEVGGKGDIGQYLAAMEMLSHHDLSLVIKFGVQFGLFGGSILMLGTARHHQKYLPDVGTLALPGCFAMTELGHGSNVRDIETQAVYDQETGEFIIHTPAESARKEYIGNAARHGRLATVFAQLEIAGEQYGVTPFLVPIRDEAGHPLPGVCIEDNGWKMGLNGVDNGRLWFDHVRIPRQNLLNRFADVSADGVYTSAIPGESRRFFTMLSTLVGGRVGISLAGLSAAKTALTIAIRYAVRRRQFGPPGQSETVLLDYPTHQRRLLPRLAKVYALDFALKNLQARFEQRTEADGREVEALAAGLKAFTTWHTTDTIQECREACGGQGYMAANRFAALKADSDIFTTFEGDNTVLMQLVAKACLSEFRQQFHDLNFFTLVGFISRRAALVLADWNPVAKRQTDPDHLQNSQFHLDAFRHREQELLIETAGQLKKRLDQGIEAYDAFVDVQTRLIEAAQAFVERLVLEQFVTGIERAEVALRPVLKRLCDLFALSTIEMHKGWYLEHGYMEGGKTKAISLQVNALCAALRPDARALVDAFGIPDTILAETIGSS